MNTAERCSFYERMAPYIIPSIVESFSSAVTFQPGIFRSTMRQQQIYISTVRPFSTLTNLAWLRFPSKPIASCFEIIWFSIPGWVNWRWGAGKYIDVLTCCSLIALLPSRALLKSNFLTSSEWFLCHADYLLWLVAFRTDRTCLRYVHSARHDCEYFQGVKYSSWLILVFRTKPLATTNIERGIQPIPLPFSLFMTMRFRARYYLPHFHLPTLTPSYIANLLKAQCTAPS